ncbi:MAG: hypothetical protein HY364_05015 [Candidatus Aenigmarchaeota archaeon]|nr:hypothetical protein [Candidatus Aenigmarchaeota archaeon]
MRRALEDVGFVVRLALPSNEENGYREALSFLRLRPLGNRAPLEEVVVQYTLPDGTCELIYNFGREFLIGSSFLLKYSPEGELLSNDGRLLYAHGCIFRPSEETLD